MSTTPMQLRSPGQPDLTAVRGEVTQPGCRRISHGLYRRLTGLDSFSEFVLDLKAWVLVLPEGAVFTGLTGARLRGWELPFLPEQVPVFAAVRGTRAPRRPGLLCSRLVHDAPPATRWDLPVDSAAEILLRCARELGTLDMVVLVDAALACGDLGHDDLQQVLTSRRPGTSVLRAAHQLASGAAADAEESVRGTFRRVMELPSLASEDEPEPELDDVLQRPAGVMHELDRALQRPHDTRRLRRWRDLVSGSLRDERTRERMMNRWRRLSGGLLTIA